jgi:hypothetical protein
MTLVAAGLAASELLAGGRPLAAAHTLAVCALFAVTAPAAWRALLGSHTRGLPPAARAWRVGAYATIGAVVVLGGALVGARALGLRATVLTDSAGLPVAQVLCWVGGWGLGRDIELSLSLERERQRAEALGRAAEHAQLLALKSQLDPHFLFNTLNAIAEWCREDPEVAEQATLRLAAMLRLIFDAVRVERWPLGRELELVEALWALHRVRDPQRFAFAVDGAGAEAEVPPLLLLPLAENAMTHGVWRGAHGDLRLAVTGDEQLAVSIESPGAYQPERGDGHGLASVRQRLELTWGALASLHIGAAPGEPSRTRVVVRFPRAVPP